MKKCLMMLAVFFGLFILTGCGDSPADVAEKWATAIADGDVNAANEYSTEDVHVLNALMIKMLNEEDAKREEFRSEIKTISDSDCEIEGDVAWLKGDDGEKTMRLIKQNGKWLVTVDKENQN